jgi:ferritin
MLNPKSKEILQQAAKDELTAAHHYHHLAAQMQAAGFMGAMAFFEAEAEAELRHFKEIRDFVNDMGDVLTLPALDAADQQIPSIMNALQYAMEMEEMLLKDYQQHAETAFQQKDMATFSFLIKFVDRQVASVGEYRDLISLWYKNPQDVFAFDNILKEKA